MRADDTQRILTEEGPQRPDGSSRVAPSARAVRKSLLWIAALICLALLAATAGEMWTLGHERQMVAQTRSENQRIARDIQQTRQAVDQAQAPDTIEREARNLGYIYPGETPVIIAQPQP